jgi:hypothetical protein
LGKETGGGERTLSVSTGTVVVGVAAVFVGAAVVVGAMLVVFADNGVQLPDGSYKKFIDGSQNQLADGS